MTKSVSQRIEESLKSSDAEQKFRVMDLMRQTWTEYASEIRRLTTLLILLVALFEIATSGKETTITISSFQISRHSIASTLLPALVAYLFCQIEIDSAKSGRSGNAFRESFRLWCPGGVKNDLHLLIQGPLPLYANSITYSSSKFREGIDSIEDFASFAFIWIFKVGILAFEAQAYYVTFSGAFLWFISLILTLFFLTLGFIAFFK